MTPDLFLALLGFALAATITPGPNNIMVMASGANFGYARTLPHILGITVGFVFMIAVVGLGAGRVFAAYPWVETALTAAAFAFLLYLAWKTATAAPPEAKAGGSRPLSFPAAAAFQWVNPKAWAMALSAIAIYAPGGAPVSALLVAAAFGIVAIPCISLWTLAGTRLRRLLERPIRRRLFNGTMAALLVISMAPALLSA